MWRLAHGSANIYQPHLWSQCPTPYRGIHALCQSKLRGACIIYLFNGLRNNLGVVSLRSPSPGRMGVSPHFAVWQWELRPPDVCSERSPRPSRAYRSSTSSPAFPQYKCAIPPNIQCMLNLGVNQPVKNKQQHVFVISNDQARHLSKSKRSSRVLGWIGKK